MLYCRLSFWMTFFGGLSLLNCHAQKTTLSRSTSKENSASTVVLTGEGGGTVSTSGATVKIPPGKSIDKLILTITRLDESIISPEGLSSIGNLYRVSLTDQLRNSVSQIPETVDITFEIPFEGDLPSKSDIFISQFDSLSKALTGLIPSTSITLKNSVLTVKLQVTGDINRLYQVGITLTSGSIPPALWQKSAQVQGFHVLGISSASAIALWSPPQSGINLDGYLLALLAKSNVTALDQESLCSKFNIIYPKDSFSMQLSNLRASTEYVLGICAFRTLEGSARSVSLVSKLRFSTLPESTPAPTPTSVTTPTPTPTPVSRIKLSTTTHTNSTCVVLKSGYGKCWGNNSAGQLGYGDTTSRGVASSQMGSNLPTLSLGTGRTIKSIATGYEHTCAILDNDTVKCWGSNAYGQLGLGDNTDRGDNSGEMGDSLPAVNLGTNRTAKAIAAGSHFSCAILDNDALKCWGRSNFGQLGQGDTVTRGDGSNEMGDHLSSINLGTGRTAKSVTVGAVHACAVLDNDTLKCWGYNATGELGQSDTTNRGDSANQMGDHLSAIDFGGGLTVKSVVSGNHETCAILSNNAMKCWGGYSTGQLGQGDTANRGDTPGTAVSSLAAIDLGSGRTAKSMSANLLSTCAILDNGAVKCWGYNGQGQLGLGNTTDKGGHTGEMGDALANVSLGTGRTAQSISGGMDHTCVVLDNDTVKCWGANFYGQLGQGNVAPKGNSSGQMGDSLLPIVIE